MSDERVGIKIVGVYMHQENERPAQHFVLYRDNQGRRMPIWIGQFEAWAISFALEGEPPERPMTHDMMLLILEATGTVMEEAYINDLRDETFYATVTLRRQDGETRVLDVRPSDAAAMAVRAKCPMYAAERVMAAMARDDHGNWSPEDSPA